MAKSKSPRKRVNLSVDVEAYKQARIQCLKDDRNISNVTDELWKLYASGKVVLPSPSKGARKPQ